MVLATILLAVSADLSDCPARYSHPSDGWLTVKWAHYRLGDCVKLNDKTACSYITDNNKTRSTLMYNYSHQSKGAKPNITLLAALVRNMQCPHPPSDSLVMHFRLGDVIELSKTPVATMISDGGSSHPPHGAAFAHAIKSLNEIYDDMRSVNLTSVSIVGGTHLAAYSGRRAPKSFAYFHCIVEGLRARNVTVHTRLDMNPDQSFCYASSARYFGVGVGGFSRLIGQVVRALGIVRIGRIF